VRGNMATAFAAQQGMQHMWVLEHSSSSSSSSKAGSTGNYQLLAASAHVCLCHNILTVGRRALRWPQMSEPAKQGMGGCRDGAWSLDAPNSCHSSTAAIYLLLTLRHSC
jgi:hypothetical protein